MLKAVMLASTLALGLAPADDCGGSTAAPVSASGVQKADVKIATNAQGMTVEQQNIHDRLLRDNTPGSIKFLYIISPMTGDVLMFSTVKGKVTSGGKRLTPVSVTGHLYSTDNNTCSNGFSVEIGGQWYCTQEVLQDDGTYGSSGEYIFWFDAKGVYHQLGTAGSIWHVSDQPMAIHHTVLNLDTGAQEESASPPDPSTLPARGRK